MYTRVVSLSDRVWFQIQYKLTRSHTWTIGVGDLNIGNGLKRKCDGAASTRSKGKVLGGTPPCRCHYVNVGRFRTRNFCLLCCESRHELDVAKVGLRLMSTNTWTSKDSLFSTTLVLS